LKKKELQEGRKVLDQLERRFKINSFVPKFILV